MDKEFLVGCIAAVTALLIIAAGIVGYHKVYYDAQLEFERICISGGKGVEMRDLSGHLISECK